MVSPFHIIPSSENKVSFNKYIAMAGVKDQIDPSIKLYGLDFGKKKSATPPGTVDLDSLLDKASSGPLSGPQRSQFGDKMLYIYTSGTTGLPKAVSNTKVCDRLVE